MFDNKKIGVTVGKFKPLHSGHELMIEMAAAELDQLVVIVSDTNDHVEFGMTVRTRFDRVRRAFAHLPNVKVVLEYDTHGDAVQYDTHGTAVDDDFWNYWIGVFARHAPDASHFVSSDRYGQEAALRLTKHLGRIVTWFPVDPDRELYDVSATRIRKDPIKNWKFIHPEFRDLFGKRVLVIGPESSGKSTLVRALGGSLNSPAVPEYGRILSEAHSNNLTLEHFVEIARRHRFMEDYAMRNSETGVVISDTDAFTTLLFGEVYLEDDSSTIFSAFQQYIDIHRYDLVILLYPDLEWDDDGTRVLPEFAQRFNFYRELLRAYSDNPRLRIIKNVGNLQQRVDLVSIEISKILEKSNSEVFNNLTSKLTSVSLV